MSQYYHFDIARASWAETWRHSPTIPVFSILALRRLCGVKTHPKSGVALDGLSFIESHAVPNHVAAKLAPVIDACAAFEMRQCAWATVGSIGPVEAYTVGMLANDRRLYAAAGLVRTTISGHCCEEQTLGAFSRLAGNRLLQTNNMKKQWDNPPSGFSVVHLPGAYVLGVLNKHYERLAEVPSQTIIGLDESLVRETMQDASKRFQDHMIQRGVLVALSDDDLQAIIGNGDQCRTAQ